jgi:AcrR family transcriptional regulator
MTPAQRAGGGGSKAAVSAETRGALLEAGASLLRDDPVGSVLSQITGRAVAERAGRTTGAFYHQWPSQEAFHRDLMSYILDPARIPSTADAARAILTGLSSGLPPDELLRQAAAANFAGVRADPYVPLWFALWAKHARDEHVTELLRDNFHAVTAQVIPLFAGLLQASGRAMRPPFTVETMAVTATALVQGLSLRAAVDPDAVPMGHPGSATDDAAPAWDLFGTLLVELFRAVTEEAPQPPSGARPAG